MAEDDPTTGGNQPSTFHVGHCSVPKFHGKALVNYLGQKRTSVGNWPHSTLPLPDRPCSCCGNRRGHSNRRYCKACHAAYSRAHRPGYSELSPEARRRSQVRVYANQHRQQGLLVPEPCEHCGAPDVQMHHEDYSKPLLIKWLCKDCHDKIPSAPLPYTTVGHWAKSSLPKAERPCSRCGGPRGQAYHRYCNACRAADMRACRRRQSELTPEALDDDMAP